MKVVHAIFSALVCAIIVSNPVRGEEKEDSEAATRKLVEQCIRQMTGRDGAGRAISFHTLQKLGPGAIDAVPALTKVLAHEDDNVRIQSAHTLWKIDGRASAISLLAKALENQEIEVKDRALAADLLRQAGPDAKAALPALTKAAKDQAVEIRVNAAWGLWTVGQQSKMAKPILADALKSDDLNVFAKASFALGEIGFDKNVLTALGEVLGDDDEGSKAYAARRILPALAEALEDDDAELRKEAISVMSRMGQTISTLGARNAGAQAAIIALKKANQDQDAVVRAAAGKVLGTINPKVVASVESKVETQHKKPSSDASGPEEIARAFLVAIAEKKLEEALKYIIPDERNEFANALKQGVPPLPENPELRVRLKKGGDRAGVSVLNAKRPGSGAPFGLNMKLSEGKWWIVK
ncbi:MAG: HEAT repeat domain-containing protein [Akkermansiaceae bacterium]